MFFLLLLLFRVSAFVLFRVFPCSSVSLLFLLLYAFSVSLLLSFSVFFRVRPWLILLLRQPSLTLPALNGNSEIHFLIAP